MDSQLVLFELQICPSDYRFAVAPEQVLVFGYKEGNDVRPRTAALPYKGNEERFQSLLESLNWLVLANDIMGLPPRDPENVFEPKYMNDPSIHIHLAYSDGKRWKSRYPLTEMPPNVQALVDQSKYLGQQQLEDALPKPDTAARPGAGPKSPAAARAAEIAMLEQQQMQEPARPVAKVKLFLSGKIELDGQEVSPVELQESLRQLRLQSGEVWYYRENPHEPLPSNLMLIARFIVDSINALRLTMRICTEDFS